MSVSGTNPFYVPGRYAQLFGSAPEPPGGTQTSQYGLDIREGDWNSAWYGHLRNMGVPDDNSGFARWLAGKTDSFRRGYTSASTETLNLDIDKYMSTLGNYGDWYKRFKSEAPVIRGEQPQQYGNQSRWLNW